MSSHETKQRVFAVLGAGKQGTAAAYDFQKNPGRVPVRETAESELLVFLLRNAPFQRQTHTQPFPPAKLGRILNGPQPYRVPGFLF